MIVTDIIANVDGTLEYVERELTPQEEEWAINGEPQEEIPISAQDTVDSMLVDHEYRISLLELGI